MGIQIIIANTDELTAQDRQVLALLGGDSIPTVTAEPRTGDEQSAAKPAKKATAKKAAAKKPDPVEEPEEEEEEDDDLVGDDGPTMADAVARATELVSAKRAPEVKAALANLDVEKVSHLKGDQIAAFLEALED